jgi:ABC-type uncharacterized transport system ATPase subunit
MLEALQLTKFYGSLPAVQNVTFRMAPGSVLGYLGPNGSGKSTTVKMLIGLLWPTHGEVRFDGQNIQQDLVAYRFFYKVVFATWTQQAFGRFIIQTLWRSEVHQQVFLFSLPSVSWRAQECWPACLCTSQALEVLCCPPRFFPFL